MFAYMLRAADGKPMLRATRYESIREALKEAAHHADLSDCAIELITLDDKGNAKETWLVSPEIKGVRNMPRVTHPKPMNVSTGIGS